MSLVRYLGRKLAWYAGALVVAVLLNFLLPRLLPGNPVDTIVSTLGRSGAEGDQLRRVYESYSQTFGLDKPVCEQFLIYLRNLLHGNLGISYTTYPAPVSGLIGDALPWTVGLQLPAIVLGWVGGNALGAIAAYRSGWFDRGAFLNSLLVSSIPPYCLAIVLLYLFAVVVPALPASGGYSFGATPQWSSAFAGDVLRHSWLPFLSLLLVFVGGQAVGMRSMAIYELGSDYVDYGRGMGLRDSRIIRYIFRNAMLPQITGLALSIGTMVSTALITELVFSYPGLGTLLFNAISQADYPVISGITLIITVVTLAGNLLVDVAYGFIDPRIRAAGAGER